MNEIFSNADDCCLLARKLKKQLGDKIDFYGSVNTPIPSGQYLSSYRRGNGEYFSYNLNCIQFYFKFAENGFLRISVGSLLRVNLLGEKLAALSDFYEVLSEEYGEPTVFYTTKDDDEGLLSLQWSFANKDEEIARFQSGKYFDDAEIDTLIVLGQNKDNTEGYGLSDTTKRIISRRVGLPFELLALADEDIENFVKHKTGKEMNISEVTKADGYSATSFEKRLDIKL